MEKENLSQQGVMSNVFKNIIDNAYVSYRISTEIEELIERLSQLKGRKFAMTYYELLKKEAYGQKYSNSDYIISHLKNKIKGVMNEPR